MRKIFNVEIGCRKLCDTDISCESHVRLGIFFFFFFAHVILIIFGVLNLDNSV